ncbi:tetratricopeptide repeat protein [Glutamicibacter mishrai]|uniref:Tetratricopeptide repeat protein n=1 Tax=Glutamicibacter mishrai TaxID=1775880 RepID=A0A6H0SP23_9MICC|nr:tetratricopeptide repeat protein [Glutamicibacter mishrai]QIV88095.1 tetratricopeptide repeat protein [Glutamicibacter mishrai]
MSNDFRRSSDNGRGDFRNSDSNRNNSRDGFKRRDDRGEFKRSEDRGGFKRNEDRGGFRNDRRDDNRGGFKRNEDRGGFRNDRRDDNRGGFKRNEDRGGFRNDRRDDNRGGFKRNEDRGGFRNDRRDDNRGGFKRNEDRGGFRNDRRDDNRGGFKRNEDRGGFRNDRRDDNRGGFKRNEDRGGFRQDRDDNRGGFKRNEDRGGFRQDRDDNRGGFKRNEDRGGFRNDRRDDNRGGFKRNEDRGGFRNDRRDDNRGGFKRNEDRGGFRNDRRDDNRGGFKRNEDRGGFRNDRRDDNRGGFKRNEDRGGFRNDRRDDNRGGFKRNDDRGNFRKDDRSKGDRPARGQRFEDPRAEAARPHNPGDLRISNRADRSQSPDIDEDVTGKELDRVARAQLRYLEERSASWVAKHLVMAGRLLEEDPELAYEHTLAASRRGGRVAVVREAVGIAAYHAGKYADALRELRTHRRISGSDYNLPLIADSLRALGRPEKAIELAHSEESANLEAAVKVEMQIVAAGAYGDQGKLDEALAELESLEQLNFNRAFSFSPRLFTAYADLLSAAGRSEDAKRWNQQVEVAERALGIEQETESFIMDLAPEMDEEEEAPRAKDLIESGQDEEDAEDAEVAESGIDEEDGLVEIAESDTEAEPADAEDESSK